MAGLLPCQATEEFACLGTGSFPWCEVSRAVAQIEQDKRDAEGGLASMDNDGAGPCHVWGIVGEGVGSGNGIGLWPRVQYGGACECSKVIVVSSMQVGIKAMIRYLERLLPL